MIIKQMNFFGLHWRIEEKNIFLPTIAAKLEDIALLIEKEIGKYRPLEVDGKKPIVQNHLTYIYRSNYSSIITAILYNEGSFGMGLYAYYPEEKDMWPGFMRRGIENGIKERMYERGYRIIGMM